LKKGNRLVAILRAVWQPFFCLFYFLFSIVQLIVLLCLPRKTFSRFFDNSREVLFRTNIQLMRPHLRPGERVLDIGAGDGGFGHRLQQELGVTVEGVDVSDYNLAPIKVHLYDGVTLPFADASFDAALLVFVLHHCSDPESVLTEALRVAKEGIFVFEDTSDSPWQRLFTIWNDIHTNILQGFIKVLKGYARPGVTRMPMPFRFRSVEGWLDMFRRYPVNVEDTAVLPSGYKPLTHTMFFLKKEPGPGSPVQVHDP
jgi:ubiquinone/menaquinone biosynthesis C-methylase UbiE